MPWNIEALSRHFGENAPVEGPLTVDIPDRRIRLQLRAVESLLDEGRHEEAEAEARQVLEGDPSCVAALILLGQALGARKRWAEAAEATLRAREATPGLSALDYVVGTQLLAADQCDLAIPLLERYRDLHPDHLATRAWLAAAYLGMERTPEAYAESLAANRINPEFDIADFFFSADTLLHGEPAQALAAFEAMLEDPAPHGVAAGLHMVVAALRYRAGDLDGAVEAANIAVDLDPADSDARLLAGRLALEDEDYERAVEHFRAIAAVAPTREVLGDLACALWMDDEEDEARDLSESLAYGSEPYWMGFKVLASMAFEEEDVHRAADLYAEAARLAGAASEYYNAGQALAIAGRDTEAAEAFERAVALEPRYVMAHVELARAAGRLGDAPRAMRHQKLVAMLDAEAGRTLLTDLLGGAGPAGPS